VARAKKIIAAFDCRITSARRGPARRPHVERLHADMARRTVAIAEAIRTRADARISIQKRAMR